MMPKRLMWKRSNNRIILSFKFKAIVFLWLAMVLLHCSHQRRIVIDHQLQPLLPLDIQAPVAENKRPFADSMRSSSVMSMVAVGDLMMGSWIIDHVRQKGVDYPFDSTRMVLQKADIAIANLEAPLSRGGRRFRDKTYTFKVPPDFCRGIANAGIDVVTLANNHILDFGCQGLHNTTAVLDSHKIAYCGAGINDSAACSVSYVEKNGAVFAFLGFSFTYPLEFWAGPDRCGTCHPSEAQMRDLIYESAARSDFIVVSFHWGQEKRQTPKPYQSYFARRAIDFGADVVLGHHPHVLQGIEIYRNKPIAYSLGNYIFGSYSYTARTSVILRLYMSRDQLIYARLYPIDVYNPVVQFQPRLLRGKKRKEVLQHLNKLSAKLNQGRNIIDLSGFIDLRPFL